jgi:hypothetical protein
VESALLLDVVVGQGTAILELLAGEDEALLVGRDALLVLDFGFHIVNGIGALDLERDGLARQGLDEDLHGSQRRCAPPPGYPDEEEKASNDTLPALCNAIARVRVCFAEHDDQPGYLSTGLDRPRSFL